MVRLWDGLDMGGGMYGRSGDKADGAVARATCGIFIHLEKDAVCVDTVLWIYHLVSSVQARFQPICALCSEQFTQPYTAAWCCSLD